MTEPPSREAAGGSRGWWWGEGRASLGGQGGLLDELLLLDLDLLFGGGRGDPDLMEEVTIGKAGSEAPGHSLCGH